MAVDKKAKRWSAKVVLITAKRQCVIRVGTAGWNIPKALRTVFRGEGTYLQRYANQFNAVEINSSFYRPHRVQTYARWAASVPADFQFSVKTPKAITHEMRLQNCTARIDQFVQEIGGLGSKLGCVLVQLPPSLRFVLDIVNKFFGTFRKYFEGQLVCEPRHFTWFTQEAARVLGSHRIGRVAADPPVHPDSTAPDGFDGIQYFRLHGAPKMYYSAYDAEYLSQLRKTLTAGIEQDADVWCVFDNTAEGFATSNALTLYQSL